MLVGKVVEEFEVDGREVVIRYPRMADAEDLLEHINSLVEEGAKIARKEKEDVEGEVAWLADQLKNVEKEETVHLVVEYGGKVRGSGSVEKGNGRRSHVGELGIGLHKEVRGKGIGTRLIKTLMNEAKKRPDVEIVILEVFKNNEPAKGLYRKVGFEEAGRVGEGIRYKDKKIDSITMQKNLD